MLLRRWYFKFRSSGMWHRVVSCLHIQGKDVGSMVLRNTGTLWHHCMVSQPRRLRLEYAHITHFSIAQSSFWYHLISLSTKQFSVLNYAVSATCSTFVDTIFPLDLQMSHAIWKFNPKWTYFASNATLTMVIIVFKTFHTVTEVIVMIIHLYNSCSSIQSTGMMSQSSLSLQFIEVNNNLTKRYH